MSDQVKCPNQLRVGANGTLTQLIINGLALKYYVQALTGGEPVGDNSRFEVGKCPDNRPRYLYICNKTSGLMNGFTKDFADIAPNEMFNIFTGNSGLYRCGDDNPPCQNAKILENFSIKKKMAGKFTFSFIIFLTLFIIFLTVLFFF